MLEHKPLLAGHSCLHLSIHESFGLGLLSEILPRSGQAAHDLCTHSDPLKAPTMSHLGALSQLRSSTRQLGCIVGTLMAEPAATTNNDLLGPQNIMSRGRINVNPSLAVVSSKSLSRLTHFLDMILPQLEPVHTRWDNSSKSLLRW